MRGPPAPLSFRAEDHVEMASCAFPTPEAWQQAAFRACAAGLCVLDADRRVVQTNDAFLLMVGPGPGPLDEFMWENLLLRARPSVNCPAEATIADGREHRAEIQIMAGRSPRRLGCVTSALKDAHGQVVGVVATFEDTSAAHDISEAVAEAEEQYCSLVDHLPDAVIITAVDTGHILHVNRRATEITGLATDALLHMRLEDLWPESDRGQIMAALDIAAEQGHGRPQRAMLAPQGGKLVPLAVTAARVHYMGAMTIQVVLRDITAVVKQQQDSDLRRSRLAAHEELTRSLCTSVARAEIEARTVQGMAALVEADLYAIYLSQDHENTLTFFAQQPISPQTEARLEALVRQTIEGFEAEGAVYEDVTRTPVATAVRLDGATMELGSYLNVPITVLGRMVGLLTVAAVARDEFSLDDLTLLTTLANETSIAVDRVQIYRRSLQSERMAAVGETVATIAHYVTNLTTHLGASSHMMDYAIDTQDWDGVKRFWRISRRSINSVSRLVMSMLNYSKEREPVLEPCDIGELIRGVVEQCMESAAQHGVTVVVNMDDVCPEMCVDSEQIEHCLFNLVTNGVDAMPGGGTLTLCNEFGPGDETTGPVMGLKVSDTGPGIDREHLSRIFEPFFSSKGSKGTGIGLAVARKIVQEHGGHLQVDSEVGRGTTFTITLPIGGPE